MPVRTVVRDAVGSATARKGDLDEPFHPLRTDGSRTDYVWLKVDTTWYPSGNSGVAFELFETHYASEFGNPVMGFDANGLDIRLVLDKWPLNDTVDRDTIACSPVTNATNTFSDNDAIYEMVYSVTD